MKKVIILNGPARCGKDTAAKAVERYLGADNVAHIKMSQPLKEMAAMMIGLPIETCEQHKDTATFKGMTYRDLQIMIFNEFARYLGEDWLGEIFYKNIVKDERDYIICSDGGRPADLVKLFQNFPRGSVMVTQIMREGCTFDHDIRMYISDPRAVMKHAVNQDKDTFERQIIDMATEFFGE